MANKQTSLFDFDEPPLKAEIQNILPVLPIEENLIPVTLPSVENDTLPSLKNNVVRDAQQLSKRGRPKLSDAYLTVDLIDVPEDEILFQKKYYSIGKVAEMFKVNISLIRFWEKEFDILKPKLNGKGDRHFRPEDVKNLKLIHHLLREKKYTIEGANDFLKKNKKSDEIFSVIEELQRTKTFLIDLKLSL